MSAEQEHWAAGARVLMECKAPDGREAHHFVRQGETFVCSRQGCEAARDKHGTPLDVKEGAGRLRPPHDLSAPTLETDVGDSSPGYRAQG